MVATLIQYAILFRVRKGWSANAKKDGMCGWMEQMDLFIEER